MLNYISNLINKIYALIKNLKEQGDKNNTDALNQNNQKPKEKNIFGGDNPLPQLEYMRMIELLHNHYKSCEIKQGHICAKEMKQRLAKLSHHEVKTLFDAILEIKINCKEYKDDK